MTAEQQRIGAQPVGYIGRQGNRSRGFSNDILVCFIKQRNKRSNGSSLVESQLREGSQDTMA